MFELRQRNVRAGEKQTEDVLERDPTHPGGTTQPGSPQRRPAPAGHRRTRRWRAGGAALGATALALGAAACGSSATSTSSRGGSTATTSGTAVPSVLRLGYLV